MLILAIQKTSLEGRKRREGECHWSRVFKIVRFLRSQKTYRTKEGGQTLRHLSWFALDLKGTGQTSARAVGRQGI